MTSIWILFFSYQDDARSNTHQICASLLFKSPFSKRTSFTPVLSTSPLTWTLSLCNQLHAVSTCRPQCTAPLQQPTIWQTRTVGFDRWRTWASKGTAGSSHFWQFGTWRGFTQPRQVTVAKHSAGRWFVPCVVAFIYVHYTLFYIILVTYSIWRYSVFVKYLQYMVVQCFCEVHTVYGGTVCLWSTWAVLASKRSNSSFVEQRSV